MSNNGEYTANTAALKWAIGLLMTIVLGLLGTLYSVNVAQAQDFRDRLNSQEEQIVLLREVNARNMMHLENIDSHISQILNLIRDTRKGL